MPATYTAEHLTSRSERRMVDFDPDATSATLVTLDPANSAQCVEVAGFRRFLAGVCKSVGTGAVSKVEIVAATDAAGTGATVIAEKTTSADAVGDTVWIECDAAQVTEVLPGATHVGVRVTLATGTDECVVFFERADPFYAHAGLTADYIAS